MALGGSAQVVSIVGHVRHLLAEGPHVTCSHSVTGCALNVSEKGYGETSGLAIRTHA